MITTRTLSRLKDPRGKCCNNVEACGEPPTHELEVKVRHRLPKSRRSREQVGIVYLCHAHALRYAKRHDVEIDGRCSICGCTDDNACPGGCAWADEQHRLCSECAR